MHYRLLSLFVILFIASTHLASAQRIVGGLESNTDKSMTPDDPFTGEDDDEDGEKHKLVPVDVKAWTIDPIYGNRTSTYVDTITALYPSRTLNEGANGHYNHLGNLGTPRLNRVYMERAEADEFIFVNPYDQFYMSTPQFRFYNTKSPFLNADYSWCGDKQSGDSHIKVTFTTNAGKRINFGALFDYIYGEGYYTGQSTAHMGTSAFASYLGDQYDFHLYYTHNHMKEGENGGIVSEEYITKPENQKKSYDSNDIPTVLTQTWGRQDHDILHFNHRYNIGFTRTDSDSVKVYDTFVPVTSIFHTFHLQSMKRRYIAYNTPANYHTYTYLQGDSTNDRTQYMQIKNIIGLSLREGFNRYAVAGINAYVGFDHRRYKMIDGDGLTIDDVNKVIRSFQSLSEQSESSVLIGGQIIRTQGTMIHYNVAAELITAGDNSGDFNVNGHGELNIPILGDTAQVCVDALVQNKTPSYYVRHYHSRHAWWDIDDMSRETRSRIMGTVRFDKTNTTLTVGFENIKNFTHFADNGTLSTATNAADNPLQRYTHNVMPVQHSGDIQVFSADLRQNFKFGPVHLDNEITYQHTSKSAPLPLPALTLFHNLYLEFKIAKVLNCQIGGDVRYFTEYNAPAYSPVIGQYMTQNSNNEIKIGNYPVISAYANFDLKRTRFYVEYYHANQSDGRYFWAPGYPVNPSCLRMGISWNFYD